MLTPISFSIRGKWSLLNLLVAGNTSSDENHGRICILQRIGVIFVCRSFNLVALDFNSMESLFDSSQKDLLCSSEDILLQTQYEMTIGSFKMKRHINSLTVSSSNAYISVLSSTHEGEGQYFLGIHSCSMILDGVSWDESCVFRKSFDSHNYSNGIAIGEWTHVISSNVFSLAYGSSLFVISISDVVSCKEVTLAQEINHLSWSPDNSDSLAVATESDIYILDQELNILSTFKPFGLSVSYELIYCHWLENDHVAILIGYIDKESHITSMALLSQASPDDKYSLNLKYDLNNSVCYDSHMDENLKYKYHTSYISQRKVIIVSSNRASEYKLLRYDPSNESEPLYTEDPEDEDDMNLPINEEFEPSFANDMVVSPISNKTYILKDSDVIQTQPLIVLFSSTNILMFVSYFDLVQPQYVTSSSDVVINMPYKEYYTHVLKLPQLKCDVDDKVRVVGTKEPEVDVINLDSRSLSTSTIADLEIKSSLPSTLVSPAGKFSFGRSVFIDNPIVTPVPPQNFIFTAPSIFNTSTSANQSGVSIVTSSEVINKPFLKNDDVMNMNTTISSKSNVNTSKPIVSTRVFSHELDSETVPLLSNKSSHKKRTDIVHEFSPLPLKLRKANSMAFLSKVETYLSDLEKSFKQTRLAYTEVSELLYKTRNTCSEYETKAIMLKTLCLDLIPVVKRLQHIRYSSLHLGMAAGVDTTDNLLYGIFSQDLDPVSEKQKSELNDRMSSLKQETMLLMRGKFGSNNSTGNVFDMSFKSGMGSTFLDLKNRVNIASERFILVETSDVGSRVRGMTYERKEYHIVKKWKQILNERRFHMKVKNQQSNIRDEGHTDRNEDKHGDKRVDGRTERYSNQGSKLALYSYVTDVSTREGERNEELAMELTNTPSSENYSDIVSRQFRTSININSRPFSIPFVPNNEPSVPSNTPSIPNTVPSTSSKISIPTVAPKVVSKPSLSTISPKSIIPQPPTSFVSPMTMLPPVATVAPKSIVPQPPFPSATSIVDKPSQPSLFSFPSNGSEVPSFASFSFSGNTSIPSGVSISATTFGTNNNFSSITPSNPQSVSFAVSKPDEPIISPSKSSQSSQPPIASLAPSKSSQSSQPPIASLAPSKSSQSSQPPIASLAPSKSSQSSQPPIASLAPSKSSQSSQPPIASLAPSKSSQSSQPPIASLAPSKSSQSSQPPIASLAPSKSSQSSQPPIASLAPSKSSQSSQPPIASLAPSKSSQSSQPPIASLAPSKSSQSSQPPIASLAPSKSSQSSQPPIASLAPSKSSQSSQPPIASLAPSKSSQSSQPPIASLAPSKSSQSSQPPIASLAPSKSSQSSQPPIASLAPSKSSQSSQPPIASLAPSKSSQSSQPPIASLAPSKPISDNDPSIPKPVNSKLTVVPETRIPSFAPLKPIVSEKSEGVSPVPGLSPSAFLNESKNSFISTSLKSSPFIKSSSHLQPPNLKSEEPLLSEDPSFNSLDELTDSLDKISEPVTFTVPKPDSQGSVYSIPKFGEGISSNSFSPSISSSTWLTKAATGGGSGGTFGSGNSNSPGFTSVSSSTSLFSNNSASPSTTSNKNISATSDVIPVLTPPTSLFTTSHDKSVTTTASSVLTPTKSTIFGTAPVPKISAATNLSSSPFGFSTHQFGQTTPITLNNTMTGTGFGQPSTIGQAAGTLGGGFSQPSTIGQAAGTLGVGFGGGFSKGGTAVSFGSTTPSMSSFSLAASMESDNKTKVTEIPPSSTTSNDNKYSSSSFKSFRG